MFKVNKSFEELIIEKKMFAVFCHGVWFESTIHHNGLLQNAATR